MQKRILACTLFLALAAGETAAIAAAAQKAAPDKMLTAAGTVSKLQASERALTIMANGSPMRFVWTADTKINGTLSQGAKVTVRYTTITDGQNLAHQISVGH